MPQERLPPAHGPAVPRPSPPGKYPLEPPAQEFDLAAGDFARVQRLIQRHAGVSLGEGKQALVHSRRRATGRPSFAAYLDSLDGSDAVARAERQEFINALTTHLTAFFREPHHFDLLAGARAGVYPGDAPGLNEGHLKRFFLRGVGAYAGSIRVRPQLARCVEFRPFNLMAHDWAPLGAPFDLVLCRYVMIYFDPPTQRRVLERTHAAMAPGGLLYAGHSENFAHSRDLFRLRGKTVYERC